MTAFDNPITAPPFEAPPGNQGLEGARNMTFGPLASPRFTTPAESSAFTGSQPVPFRLEGAVVPTAAIVTAGVPQSSFELAAANSTTPPSINVSMESADAQQSAVRPTARVERDGSILDGAGNVVVDKSGNVVNANFITSPPIGDALSIQVQKPSDGASALTNEQQQALNHLTEAWASRIQTSFGDKLQTVQTKDGSIAQVQIEDPSGLVSAPVEQKFGNKIPPEQLVQAPPPEAPPSDAPIVPEAPDAQGFAPRTAQTAQRVNQDFPQGGSGTISAGDANRYYPPRTPDQSEGPSGDYLNMLSGMTQQPADQMRRTPHGYSFGMFGLGSHTFGDWLAGVLPKDILEKLGHPPDFSKLAELLKDPKMLKELEASLKKHHVPGDLAKDLSDPAKAKEFGDFAQKLASGKGDVSSADMKKWMPEALQNRIATDTINGYKQAGTSPSDIALSMQLDKKPSELSKAERESTEGQAVVNASNRLFHLSHARQGSTSPDDQIRWTGDDTDPKSVHYRLIHAAKQHRDGTGDGCVRTFQGAMHDTFGMNVHGNGFDAFMDAAHKLVATGKYELFKINSNDDARHALFIGQQWSQVAVNRWAANHGGQIAHFGHVSVIDSNLNEASSRNYHFNINNSYYAASYGVRLKSEGSEA